MILKGWEETLSMKKIIQALKYEASCCSAYGDSQKSTYYHIRVISKKIAPKLLNVNYPFLFKDEDNILSYMSLLSLRPNKVRYTDTNINAHKQPNIIVISSKITTT